MTAILAPCSEPVRSCRASAPFTNRSPETQPTEETYRRRTGPAGSKLKEQHGSCYL